MASPSQFKGALIATATTLIVVALGAALFMRQSHRQGSYPNLVAELGLSTQLRTQLYAPIPRKAKLALAPGEVAPAEYIHTCHGMVLAEDLDQRLLPALDRQTYVPENMGLLGAGEHYLQGTDGSLEKIVMQPDGQWIRTSDTFYPRPTKHGPWHPHVHTTYADGSAFIVDEVTYWYEGKLEKVVHVDEAKRKHVLEFAEDGVTVLSEQWYQLPVNRSDFGYLISEEHWQVNAGQRTLSYSNFRHGDGTRTITTWDEHHNPLFEMSRDKYDSPAGTTTVIGYYPGTIKHRFEGVADANVDEVKFLDPNGTMYLDLEIASCTSSFTYYDRTGKNKTMIQTFLRDDVVENGVKKAIYTPMSITEFDSDGKETTLYYFSDNKVDGYEKVGVTVNGIKYKKAFFFFLDGKLSLVSHWVTDPDKPTPDDVDKNPTFTVPIPEIEGKKLQPLVQITDDLPVPPVPVPEH